MRSILLVDDDAEILDFLTGAFEDRGRSVHRAATGAGALRAYERERPDVVLLDLVLPDMDGISVLRRLREHDSAAAVIMVTGEAAIDTAVEAMRLGAENYITKPFELARLQAVVEDAEAKVRLRRHNRRLAGGDEPSPDPLGVSAAMRALATSVDRIAAGDGPALLQGETGTGKGWVARRIHERSSRRDAPFVAVSCGGLRAATLDAELFGQGAASPADAEESAGLLELAEGGTLFLDEVGDLGPVLQARILEFLDEWRGQDRGASRNVADVRLIAATTHDLMDRAARGTFREELYYRLAVLPVELPPLRDRAPEDIAVLVYRILDELSPLVGGPAPRVHDRALEALVAYSWPGNIRELRNVLERVLVLAGDIEEIRPLHLPSGLDTGEAPATGPEPLTLEAVERRHIARVLEVNHGNRSRTARTLGISRAALYDKMDRFGLRAVGM
jgi:DNA-binding NtrC family response regulator